MSARLWMITNRPRGGENLNSERGSLTYRAADGGDAVADFTHCATAFYRDRRPVLGLSAGINLRRFKTTT